MYNMVIADDDKEMRYVLRRTIEKYEDIHIIQDVESGQAAVAACEDQRIDIAFLDVDMPGLNGVEAAKLIMDINPKCAIVFITAHDTYMKDAFELYAFDYILKPFKLERLHNTLDRILKQVQPREVSVPAYHEVISNDLLLKVKGGMVVVKQDDILIIERVERQTRVITKSSQYMINKSLQEMEHLLQEGLFIRSHKSYIIRIDQIERLEVYGRWTYIVKFHDTEFDALITKEKAKLLESRFTSFD